jgi:hypothetical protein
VPLTSIFFFSLEFEVIMAPIFDVPNEDSSSFYVFGMIFSFESFIGMTLTVNE